MWDDDDILDASEDESWTEMSWDRGSNESDEDYQERMDNLEDYMD